MTNYLWNPSSGFNKTAPVAKELEQKTIEIQRQFTPILMMGESATRNMAG